MDKRLYIGDDLVQLAPDTVVAMTLQVADVADISSRNGNYTNRISVPFTPINDTIFKLARVLQSNSEKPYRKLDAKYVLDGIEVMPNAYTILDQAADSYLMTLYSGNANFFALLDGLSLRDLDLSDLNHDWNLTNVHASRTNNSGYIYPVIDYGRLADTNSNMYTYELFPSFFIHTLITRIVEAQGWTVEGEILSDDMYLKTMLAWSNSKWEHAVDFIDGLDFNTESEGLSPLQTFSGVGAHELDIEDSANVTGNAYVAPNDLKCKFIADIDFDYDSGAFSGIGPWAYFEIYNRTTSKILTSYYLPLNNNATGLNKTASVAIDNVVVADGDEIVCRLRIASAPSTIDVIVNKVYFKNFVYADIVKNAFFDLSRQLPDMSQKDFMKWMFNIFAIVPDAKSGNKTLLLRSMSELSNNIAIAPEMDGELDLTDMVVEYRLGNYAQTNNCTWTHDEGVTPNLGNSSFSIDDETLELSKNIIQMPFGASHMEHKISLFGGILDVPVIDKLDDVTGLVAKETSPRLLILRRTNLPLGISYSDGVSNILEDEDIPLCHFHLDGEEHSLSWEHLLGAYWPATLSMVERSKKIIAKWKPSSVVKLVDFDHFIPWHSTRLAADFYVNKIINYKGDVAQVELIRL